MNLLRSCAGCSAHILVNDGVSESVYCKTCRPKCVTPFDEWAAGLKPGDMVYLQPYACPIPALVRSQWLIRERNGNDLKLSILGSPDLTTETHIAHTGQHCLARRP